MSSLQFSPDNRTLASGNSKGVFFWRVRDGKLLFSRPLPPRPNFLPEPAVQELTWSQGGSFVALAGEWNTEQVRVFDFHRRRFGPNLIVEDKDGKATALAFSRDARRLAVASVWNVSASWGGLIQVFDVRGGRQLWQWPTESNKPDEYANAATFTSARWSRNEKQIAFGNGSLLQIHDARAGKQLRTHSAPNFPDPSAPNFKMPTPTQSLERQRRFHARFAVR